MQIQMEGQNWTVRCRDRPEERVELAREDGKEIDLEKVGCMTGPMVGLFAAGSGSESEHYAHFRWYRRM